MEYSTDDIILLITGQININWTCPVCDTVQDVDGNEMLLAENDFIQHLVCTNCDEVIRLEIKGGD